MGYHPLYFPFCIIFKLLLLSTFNKNLNQQQWRTKALRWNIETSLVVQWLRLCTSTAGSMGLIPCWKTKTPQARSAAKKEKKRWDISRKQMNRMIFQMKTITPRNRKEPAYATCGHGTDSKDKRNCKKYFNLGSVHWCVPEWHRHSDSETLMCIMGLSKLASVLILLTIRSFLGEKESAKMKWKNPMGTE